MRLSFDTNNYFHTTVSLGVVTFCFSGLFHSTAGPPRVLYLAMRVLSDDLKIPNSPKSSSCGV